MTNPPILKRYRVWTEGKRPEEGAVLYAETGFIARKQVAMLLGIDVTSVMARRVY